MRKIGEILIDKGWLTEKELALTLSYKNESKVLLGKILLDLSFCSAQEFERARKMQAKHPQKKIGAFLVEMSIITQPQLEKALALQQKKNGVIGEFFLELGYITHKQLDEALEIQAKELELP